MRRCHDVLYGRQPFSKSGPTIPLERQAVPVFPFRDLVPRIYCIRKIGKMYVA